MNPQDFFKKLKFNREIFRLRYEDFEVCSAILDYNEERGLLQFFISDNRLSPDSEPPSGVLDWMENVDASVPAGIPTEAFIFFQNNLVCRYSLLNKQAP